MMFRNVLLPIRWYSRGIRREIRLCQRFRPFSTTTQQQKNDDDIDLDRPIKYSSSPASRYKASLSVRGPVSRRLWYEPHVILISLFIFMVYFTILREENDIDEELNRSLYSRIDGLEEFQLKQSLKYNEVHGGDTRDIIERLQELEQMKIKDD